MKLSHRGSCSRCRSSLPPPGPSLSCTSLRILEEGKGTGWQGWRPRLRAIWGKGNWMICYKSNTIILQSSGTRGFGRNCARKWLRNRSLLLNKGLKFLRAFLIFFFEKISNGPPKLRRFCRNKQGLLSHCYYYNQDLPKWNKFSFLELGNCDKHAWAWGGGFTITPLLKGKVRIPPPAGHFFDPPCPKNFFRIPPLSREIFPHTASWNY